MDNLHDLQHKLSGYLLRERTHDIQQWIVRDGFSGIFGFDGVFEGELHHVAAIVLEYWWRHEEGIGLFMQLVRETSNSEELIKRFVEEIPKYIIKTEKQIRRDKVMGCIIHNKLVSFDVKIEFVIDRNAGPYGPVNP